MKLHPVLIYSATLIAGITLVLAGRQVAVRFTSKEQLLDLAAPIFAVATALICIGVLDWARNLRRHSHNTAAEDPDDEVAVRRGRGAAPASAADLALVGTLHRLEGLANEELGPERTLEEALKAVADFARASEVGLWLCDEAGQPQPRADCSEGEVVLHEGIALDPADAEPVRQAIECRKPLESTEGGLAHFLFPLVSGQGCFGALRVSVPVGEPEEAGDAPQLLSAQLAQVARQFACAVSAPGLYDRAVTDALTALYSRRHFVNRLTEATGVSRRYGEPLSLVLMDVDNFKMVNGTYGPATGDRVLRNVASLIQQNVREVDSAFRYGADEFAVILPNTEADRARTFADRIRRVVRDSRVVADDGGAIISTVSLGVAEFDEDMRGIGPLIAQAEEALYAAREKGRDRVETAPLPAQPSASGGIA